MNNPNIATTILAQLGGKRFCIMTGPKALIDIGNGLRIQLPFRNLGTPNFVTVKLTPRDTYEVKFESIARGQHITVSEHDDVYCDGLVELFEKATGLATRL